MLVRETVVRSTSYPRHVPLNSKGDGSAKGEDENSIRDQCDSSQAVVVKVSGCHIVLWPMKHFTIRRKKVNLASKSCISNFWTDNLCLFLAFKISEITVHTLLHIICILQWKKENKISWFLARHHFSSLHEPIIWNWRWSKLKWRNSPLGTCRKD